MAANVETMFYRKTVARYGNEGGESPLFCRCFTAGRAGLEGGTGSHLYGERRYHPRLSGKYPRQRQKSARRRDRPLQDHPESGGFCFY